MSYLYQNNVNLIEKSFELLTQQLIILNQKIELLEEKIDNINVYFKIINNNQKYNARTNDIDWECVHLY